jgi:hypothetical protein
MGAHLIDGEFQSDKYPETRRGLVPLSCKDKSAQNLLWEYAQRRRAVDAEFADDLEQALRLKGYDPVAEGLKKLPRKLATVAELLDLSVEELKDLLLQEMENQLGEFEEEDVNQFPNAEALSFTIGCEAEEEGDRLVRLLVTCGDGEAKRLRTMLDTLVKTGEDVVQFTVSGLLTKTEEE